MRKSDIIRFFDKLSSEWDSGLEPNDVKMKVILDTAGVKSGDCVLDIACGTGVMIDYYLARNVSAVTGIDISKGMAEIAEKKYAGNERVTIICGDAESYSFSSQYDRCVIFNAFPHFCSPQSLFENLYKVIRKGGTLTVAHDWGRKEIDRRHKDSASSVSNGLMSADELEKIFLSCGFSDITKSDEDEIYIVSGKKE